MASTSMQIYFSVPDAAIGTEIYAGVVAQLRARHADATILEPVALWKQWPHWESSYRKALKSVTRFYVLLTGSTVNEQCYQECQYFIKKGVPVTGMTRYGYEPVSFLEIVNDGSNDAAYARVVFSTEGREKYR